MIKMDDDGFLFKHIGSNLNALPKDLRLFFYRLDGNIEIGVGPYPNWGSLNILDVVQAIRDDVYVVRTLPYEDWDFITGLAEGLIEKEEINSATFEPSSLARRGMRI